MLKSKTIEEINEELARLDEKMRPLYQELYKRGPTSYDRSYDRLNRKIGKLEQESRKLVKKGSDIRHREMYGEGQDPKWITWKQYGFRHIQGASTKGGRGFFGSGTTHHSLCGGSFSERFFGDYDPRGTNRPLCGNCRKAYKKYAGKDPE